jgi:hypothetical protein
MSASRPISGLSNRLWTATNALWLFLCRAYFGRLRAIYATEVPHIPENCASLEAKDLDRHEPNARALVRARNPSERSGVCPRDGLGDLIRQDVGNTNPGDRGINRCLRRVDTKTASWTRRLSEIFRSRCERPRRGRRKVGERYACKIGQIGGGSRYPMC